MMTFDTIAEVYTATRFQLEKECVYLMKKRVVLEKLIVEREAAIEKLRNDVNTSDNMVEQLTTQISNHQTITNQTLERLNKEKDEYIQEIHRLRGEMKNVVEH